jgi:hypothetical protein
MLPPLGFVGFLSKRKRTAKRKYCNRTPNMQGCFVWGTARSFLTESHKFGKQKRMPRPEASSLKALSNAIHAFQNFIQTKRKPEPSHPKYGMKRFEFACFGGERRTRTPDPLRVMQVKFVQIRHYIERFLSFVTLA